MPDESEPSFEEALTQLEQVVEDLERGDPALSAALAKYESGVKLLRRCYQLLDGAEQAVALLTGVDDEGNPLTVPFDASATVAREPGPAAPASAGGMSTSRPDSDEPGTPVQPPGRAMREIAREFPIEDSDPPF
jgi:exodeoxyribonuclease VII small subunit